MNTPTAPSNYCGKFSKKQLAFALMEKYNVPGLLMTRKDSRLSNPRKMYEYLCSFPKLIKELGLENYEDYKALEFIGEKAKVTCGHLELGVGDFL